MEIKDIEIVPVIESIIEFLEDFPETNVSKVCETFGITYYIFNKNIKKLPDLKRRYQEFKNDRDACLAEKGKNSFAKLAEGYTFEEVKTTYDKDGNIKERVVYEKLKHPDYKAACIISGKRPDSVADEIPVTSNDTRTTGTKRLTDKEWEEKWKNGQVPKNVKPIKPIKAKE